MNLSYMKLNFSFNMFKGNYTKTKTFGKIKQLNE